MNSKLPLAFLVFYSLGFALDCVKKSTEAKASEISVEQLKSLYTQQIAEVSRFEVSTLFEGVQAVNPKFVDNSEAELDRLVLQIRASKEWQDGIRNDAKTRGIEIGPEVKDIEFFVRDRAQEGTKDVLSRQQVKFQHLWRRGENRELVVLDEEGQAVTSLLYGAAQPLLPSASSDRWTALEIDNSRGREHAWSKSIVQVKGMIPVGFEHSSLRCMHDSEYQGFWDSGSEIHRLGQHQIGTSSFEVFCTQHRNFQNNWLVAAFNSPVSIAVPSWIVQVAPPDSSIHLTPLEISNAIEFLGDVLKNLQSRNVLEVKNEPLGLPIKLTTFHSLEPIGGFVGYPNIIHHYIPMVTRGVSASTKIGPMHEFILKVNSTSAFKTRDGLLNVKLEKGMPYLDRDTNRSWVIGDPVPAVHLGEYVQQSRIVIWSIIVILTIVLILVRVYRRKNVVA